MQQSSHLHIILSQFAVRSNPGHNSVSNIDILSNTKESSISYSIDATGLFPKFSNAKLMSEIEWETIRSDSTNQINLFQLNLL